MALHFPAIQTRLIKQQVHFFTLEAYDSSHKVTPEGAVFRR